MQCFNDSSIVTILVVLYAIFAVSVSTNPPRPQPPPPPGPSNDNECGPDIGEIIGAPIGPINPNKCRPRRHQIPPSTIRCNTGDGKRYSRCPCIVQCGNDTNQLSDCDAQRICRPGCECLPGYRHETRIDDSFVCVPHLKCVQR